MNVIGVIIVLVLGAAILALPGAWIVMLALGNFGLSQFGLVDCIPAGLIIGALANSGN